MILGPASAQLGHVLARLPSGAHARLRDEMVPALWAAAEVYGIDPVGIVAQAGKETGWGTYRGNVKAEFHNTCGLKVTAQQMRLFPGVTDGDNPLAHAMFPSWSVGAMAHAQHLCRYAGLELSGELIVDPRFNLVVLDSARTWAALGGRWAPSSTYGAEIEAIIRTLVG